MSAGFAQGKTIKIELWELRAKAAWVPACRPGSESVRAVPQSAMAGPDPEWALAEWAAGMGDRSWLAYDPGAMGFPSEGSLPRVHTPDARAQRFPEKAAQKTG
jgi:hypothetical protein